MFFRQKRVKGDTYLQIVENRWEKGKTRQRVLGTIGRLDQLQESGQLEGLLESGARFAQSILVLSEHRHGEVPSVGGGRIGAPMIFERLWRFVLRTEARGVAGKVFQAIGVALPPTVRKVS